MRAHRITAGFCLFLLVAVGAHSFTIVPMTATLTPTAPGNVTSFRIENPGQAPIAVTVKVTTRIMDEAGLEKNDPVTKEFLVFPARVVVQPGSFQTVKVQWRGQNNPAVELAYRLIAEQVPVDFSPDQGSNVKMLFKYLATLYVMPRNAAASVRLESVTGAVVDGKPGLSVRIRNEGTRHALIFDPVLTLRSPVQAVVSGAPMESLDGQNILPRSTRVFFVPFADTEPGMKHEGSFAAEIE